MDTLVIVLWILVGVLVAANIGTYFCIGKLQTKVQVAEAELEAKKKAEKEAAKAAKKTAKKVEVESAPKNTPKKKVSVAEAKQLMSDSSANSLVKYDQRKVDLTKKAVINIDELAQYFEDGDVVNLKTLKEKVPGFPKKTTYVKVLARGTLDKKLTVELDEFSVDAEKMILLMDGTVVKPQ